MSTTQAQKHLQAKAQELASQFNLHDEQVYLLEIELHTPLMVSRYKSNVPVPGLPNLDGMLQYAAFYWCASACVAEHPDLATYYLWQVNDALEGQGWIDFPIPLHAVNINHPGTTVQQRLYDCSVGLPVDPSSRKSCYPVGGEFLREDGQPFERTIDNLPLRRRVPHPETAYKPISLTSQLDTSRGSTKALDNRMYTLVVNAYRFLFRGDIEWVERLLRHLQKDNVGLGKKAALGYGRIADVRITQAETSVNATLGHLLTAGQKQAVNTATGSTIITLLKNIPSDVLFEWCADGQNNGKLLGSPEVKVLSLIPILAGYTPPHWLQSRQTLVAQYGSLLYGNP